MEYIISKNLKIAQTDNGVKFTGTDYIGESRVFVSYGEPVGLMLKDGNFITCCISKVFIDTLYTDCGEYSIKRILMIRKPI